MSTFSIEGGFEGLAVSSRVRLARNLQGYPFQGLTAAQQQEIANKVFGAIEKAPAISAEFSLQQIAAGAQESAALVERHLISPELMQSGGWLICSKDGGVAIMIGEEDHLRIQAIGSGLCPKECLAQADRIAALIENELPFAYDEQLGYLTACPTNLGTGLRASVMLHLPALTGARGMERLIGYAGRRGCAVRGAYGEGSEAIGGFYQISNQITLGVSAADLTERLIQTATEFIEAEKKARETLRTQDETALRDRICRSVGTMQSAYLMNTGEAIGCISDALVGLQMGMLSGVSPKELYRLEQQVHPALLSGDARARDEARAQMLRETGGHLQISK